VADAYLTPEDRARRAIDAQLEAAGWVVQSRDEVNVAAGLGVAIRDRRGMPDPDYLLFVDGKACGTYEAKRDGHTLTGVEGQSSRYEESIPAGAGTWGLPLRFAYEGTSFEVQFTDRADPEPRSRPVFAVHRPETLHGWLREAERLPTAPTLRSRLRQMPDHLDPQLWAHQREAIAAIEASLAADKPRALLQMATGSGKTFTAANLTYRLVKHGGARRVLFLVDRRNLGEQAQTEFEQFVTPDEQRKMSELYAVQRLSGGNLRDDAKVVISTIQGIYAALTGTAPVEDDDTGPVDGPPVDLTYSATLPPESFDVIIVDEAHRSIYGRWRPVLEYFDAHLLGLTATPTKLTFGFFHKNLVFEYDHEQAVADGNNVPFEVYKIRTRIGTEGSTVDAGEYATFRDRATRRKQLELLADDFDYDPADLDRRVVSVDQIRTVVTHFRDQLFKPAEEGGIFPGRTVVPKTLIFAKDDSHADDIVRQVREVFGKGNDFCVKITSKSTGASSDELLKRFRNDFNPRIAVTVDLIATGTDVKSIECVFFMRGVKSRSYFEQMKGRGSRVMSQPEFQAVTNDAHHPAKTHFVIVDAVGVTDVDQQDTVPLEKKRLVTLRTLLDKVGFGAADVDELSSIADRLSRIDKNLTATQRDTLTEVAGGKDLKTVVAELMVAVDPDRRQARAHQLAAEAHGSDDPTPEQIAEHLPAVLAEATATLQSLPKLRQTIVEVQQAHLQLLDEVSADEVTYSGYETDPAGKAEGVVGTWKGYIAEHRDDIDTLQVMYGQRDGKVLDRLERLAAEVKAPPYRLSPEAVWDAYERLDASRVKGQLRSQVADLLALLRFELGLEDELKPFAEVVEWRWQQWLQEQDAAARFTPEQMGWLKLMKDVATESLVITTDDFDLGELAARGGLGRAHADFDGQLGEVIAELNRELTP
jgi:type I restriction enzyme, R subunit